MRRTIKMFGMAAMASLALGAFMASAAQAGHTWEVNGAKLAAGASETCKATTDPTNSPANTLTLKGEVLTGEFHLTSTTIETTACKITQVGSGATAEAVDSVEKISFGGLTVDAPVGCKVNSPINTVPITSHIVTTEHPKGSGKIVAYLTFNPSPPAATQGTFTNITVKECAAAEVYPVKGSVCAEMPQAGVLAVEQTIKFSATADEACSGGSNPDKLTLGNKPAILRGGIILELTGAAGAGKPWGFTTT